MAAEVAQDEVRGRKAAETVSLEDSFVRPLNDEDQDSLRSPGNFIYSLPGTGWVWMRGPTGENHQVFQYDDPDTLGVSFIGTGWAELKEKEQFHVGDFVRVEYDWEEPQQYTISRVQRIVDPNDDAGAFVVPGTRLSADQWQAIRDLRIASGPEAHLLVTTLCKRVRTKALHLPKAFCDPLPDGSNEDFVFAMWDKPTAIKGRMNKYRGILQSCHGWKQFTDMHPLMPCRPYVFICKRGPPNNAFKITLVPI
ncbi:hypothetical protein ACP70R_006537 [Stipagrostis hirtigluma subsp. patula]